MTERLTHTLVHFRGVSKSFTISSAPSFSRETTLNWVGPAPRPAEIHPGRDVRWGESGAPCWPSSVWWEVPSLGLLALVLGSCTAPGVDTEFQPQSPISPVEMGWIFKSWC